MICVGIDVAKDMHDCFIWRPFMPFSVSSPAQGRSLTHI